LVGGAGGVARGGGGWGGGGGPLTPANSDRPTEMHGTWTPAMVLTLTAASLYSFSAKARVHVSVPSFVFGSFYMEWAYAYVCLSL